MEEIIQHCLKLNIEKEEMCKELLNIKIESLINGYYIIDSKIMNLIKKIGYGKNVKFNQNKIFKIENNNYFLIENNNKDILIGNINNKLIFIPKYNLYYKTP